MHFIIADDYPLSTLGTQVLIESAGYVVLGTYNNGKSAWNAIKKQKPDFAILDISMPEMTGLEVAENIKLYNIPTKIILLTSHNEKSIYTKAREWNIHAYLLKQYALEELKDCIEHLKTNEYYHSYRLQSEIVEDPDYIKNQALQKLSFVEKKIFELVVQQKSNKEIASLLFLSIKTIEAHRAEIIKKLDLEPGKNTLLKFASQFSKK